MTDPQFRSYFHRNVAPGWFAWKDELADKGFRFNLDYLALGQSSSADIGEGEAANGIFRFWFGKIWVGDNVNKGIAAYGEALVGIGATGHLWKVLV